MAKHLMVVFQGIDNYICGSLKIADYSRSASGCAPWRALRLVALYESLAGVITLILIAVLATSLLQFSLNLPVTPPDDYADTDKCDQA